ncbi:hypothetical protein CYPRO_0512 [Cyclonatronum proteinivorum]|uniref:Phosphoribosyl-AMP cyclohydrolase n=1 Tax=Cyclonatronum proteinivorum TaxID=1457365 RepID=A0A345UH46_9BACT|nr:hypothetical protein [Cyclonatronum proteinivorum]AXI99797.1 hypothetical protein CYPRO_0512 [Cyclonatronum proteinivorum]
MKKILVAITIAMVAGMLLVACTNGNTDQSYANTAEMIERAQNEWIAALVSIGAAHAEGGDAEARAREVLNNYYNFHSAPVLFKPTLAFGEQTFRPDKQGALAYFVGGDADFPNDDGFALRPYVDGFVEMADVFIHGDMAIAMSNITLEAYDGSTVTVDKTFGYILDEEGSLRIVTHHSSLPFAP